jgi:hypothetical protein
MTKAICILTAAAFLALSGTVFAQAPAPEQASPQLPVPHQEMAPPTQAPSPAPGMGEERKSEKPMKEGQGKGRDKGHSKKMSKKRGLDRADEAAGQRGKHGRDKARANQ